MENHQYLRTTLSRVVLVKENSMLVINDRLRIRFLHRRAFLVAWTVCRLIAAEARFQVLGGVPARELVGHLEIEDVNISQQALNTLWHDEVEFKRKHSFLATLYDVADLKAERQAEAHDPQFVASRLQLVFCKTKPLIPSDLHGSTKVFSVSADPEQLCLFQTLEEAAQEGIEPSGTSEVTKFRKNHDELGYLDWRQEARVDAEGTADSEVFAKVVNLSPVPMLHHLLPLWSDTREDAQARQVKAWMKNGTELDVEFLLGGQGKKRRVEFLLTFREPVTQGKTTDFYFSYHTEAAYHPGKEYLKWRINYLHARYSVDLKFTEPWIVEQPVVFVDNRDEDVFQPKRISKRHIRWIRYFPQGGSEYHISFKLSRTDKA